MARVSSPRTRSRRSPPDPVRTDLATSLRRHSRTLRARIQRVDVLADVVGEIHDTWEPGQVAERVCRRLAGWVPAASWSLVLVCADEGARRPEVLLAGPGIGERDLVTLASDVARTGEDLATARLGARLPGAREAGGVALALAWRGKVVGVLVGVDQEGASNGRPDVAALREALGPVPELVAQALRNAGRARATEALTITDHLTNLYNARFLSDALERELKRAARSGKPLSLLFLDFDEFKMVNDRLGHLAGSRALVEAGGVVRGVVRETDVVARFGGDEFAVVLPETDGEGARAVAERVRQAVASRQFLADLGHDVHLTVSVGVATLGSGGATAEQVLQAADQAMYWVKHRGKDGVRFVDLGA